LTQLVHELRDQPDPDGSIADLADRIEAEREWVLALMALGEEPARPPAGCAGRTFPAFKPAGIEGKAGGNRVRRWETPGWARSRF
jgi:hypothetical protein